MILSDNSYTLNLYKRTWACIYVFMKHVTYRKKFYIIKFDRDDNVILLVYTGRVYDRNKKKLISRVVRVIELQGKWKY